jgi:hypothetical protein
MQETRTAGSQPVAEARPPGTLSKARIAASQSTTQAEAADLIPIEDSGILRLNVVGYEAFDFGPVGRRIIAERQPGDMARLKRTLEYTDGPRTMFGNEFLPLRHCDYATLIAETLIRPGSSHSFGPWAAYEYRDDSRRDALKRLFGDGAVLPDPIRYIYLDGSGKDVSDDIRLKRRPGLP